MSLLLVALLLSSAPAAVAQVRIREVPVAISTKEGSPIDDLTAAEIEIKEAGKKRTVLSMRRDERAVDVALILDSSQWMGNDYRMTLVPAAMEFWRGLPPKARLTVWTSGGRAVHAVDFGVEPEAGEVILQKIAVGGPLFTLDAIIDASRHLQEQRSERRVMVVVTTHSIPFSENLAAGAYQAIPEARVTPVAILVKGYTGTGGGAIFGGQAQSWDVETFLQDMAKGYGGGYDLVLSPQGVNRYLSIAAAGISSQYLVRFESEAGKPSRPEVKVKRKGVQGRAGLALIAR